MKRIVEPLATAKEFPIEVSKAACSIIVNPGMMGRGGRDCNYNIRVSRRKGKPPALILPMEAAAAVCKIGQMHFSIIFTIFRIFGVFYEIGGIGQASAGHAFGADG